MKEEHYDVIVIGGGIAGLATAKKLVEEGGYRVIVLEARNRIGGRIHTVHDDDLTIDMGASWIHGMNKKNPIVALAKKSESKLFYLDDDNIIAYRTEDQELEAKGTKVIIPNKRISKEEKKFWKRIKKAQRRVDDDDYDCSLKDAIIECSKDNPSILENDEWMKYFGADLEFDYGAPLDKMSAWYHDDDEAYPGKDSFVSSGYDTIINTLSKGLDIRTNVIVRNIEYGKDGGCCCKVRTTTTINEEGENEEEEIFESNLIVCTLPLGVLKEQLSKKMFTPELPLRKVNAINQVEMGNVVKIGLLFDKVFWPTDTHYFGHVSNSKERGQYPYFINGYLLTGKPLLITFGLGNYANIIDEQTLTGEGETQVINGIMITLQSMFGSNTVGNDNDNKDNKAVSKPIKTYISKWKNDPYSCGTYSYANVGTTKRHFDILSESINNKLYFAGEHCSSKYRGTVHGAYMSGIKAANDIIKEAGASYNKPGVINKKVATNDIAKEGKVLIGADSLISAS